MTYDAKSKFENLIENAKYVRVNETHPIELYLGLDQVGKKTLRLNEKFEPQAVKSSAKIAVQQVKLGSGNTIMFGNSGDENIFYAFCNDLIETSVRCKSGEGYQFLLHRYAKWKKMFAGESSILSVNEVRGLLSELVFL
ncbi:MAG: PD-(D/E)XK motif protein, partial [Firmicutes bacterium]|nr:PD-(D/E)XK motif protein [Bacillota bacterium]